MNNAHIKDFSKCNMTFKFSNSLMPLSLLSLHYQDNKIKTKTNKKTKRKEIKTK